MTTPYATIDRFEDGHAVLLVEGREKVVPRSTLPMNAREGDVLDLVSGRVDTAETERRREEIRATRERAFQGKKPPDFDL
jgi:hypothetical protein